ncbi:hypothetical protein C1N81_44800 (plasmid) [Streptomyces sp. SGAir0957]
MDAAGVTLFPDLRQQVSDGDGRVLGATSAQMIAVGVDQTGPVYGGADHAVRLAVAGTALDGVERHAQPAGAREQADALVEEVVHLLPSLTGRGAFALGQRRAELAPAGGGP